MCVRSVNKLAKQMNSYINKIQRDETACGCLLTAKLLYMFRVSITPIIRSTLNLTAASGTGYSVRATTCTRRCSYSLMYS